MASSLDIWSILIIVSLAHSLFVITLNLYRKAYLKNDDKWLFYLLLVLFWLQLEFLSIRWPYDLKVNLLYGTRHGSWLVVGPLFYLYTKAVTKGQVPKKDLLLFLPFLVFTVMLPLILQDFLTFGKSTTACSLHLIVDQMRSIGGNICTLEFL